jgi:creatinine amidohydrolase
MTAPTVAPGMHLAEATWTEVEAADAGLALLPVGSTEQHGPHAALSTDAVTAETVASAAAAAHDREVVVAPTIPVGISAEHRHFAGTLWVSADTFRAYVRETVESLLAQGVERVVLVNGHGGNTEALREVAATVSRETDGYAVAFTWFDAAGEMGHAGPVETALLRHVRPDLVREEQVAEAAEDAAQRWGTWVAGTNLAHDVEEFAPNGVVGDPREGDAERGEDLLNAARAALCDLLDGVAER